MLTSKQRSYLRGLANEIEPIFQVGKGGVNENMIKQLIDALEARELIKITVLANSDMETRDVAGELSEGTGADVVQVIGKKIVLYKRSTKDHKINLP